MSLQPYDLCRAAIALANGTDEKKCARCREYKKDVVVLDKSYSVRYCCRECNTAHKKKWVDKNRDRDRERSSRLRKKYPSKVKARTILNNSIRYGHTSRPKNCSVCLVENDAVEAHHHDYGKPLEVVWLCRICHSKLHKTIKK